MKKEVLFFFALLLVICSSCNLHSDEEYQKLVSKLKKYESDSSSFMLFNTDTLKNNQFFLNVETIDTYRHIDPHGYARPMWQGVPITYENAQQYITNYLPNPNSTIFTQRRLWKQLRSFWMPVNIFTDYMQSANPGNIAYFKLFLAIDDASTGALSLVVIPYDVNGHYITLPNGNVYNQIAACPEICPESQNGQMNPDYDPNTNPNFYAQYDNLVDLPATDNPIIENEQFYPRYKGQNFMTPQVTINPVPIVPATRIK